MLRTRGKRVTAEATATREELRRSFDVEPEQLMHRYGVANVGAFMAGANNNGLQSANGITAMFIATGQDVANVAESSAGILYCELTPDGGLYGSLTIPSLIVATHGGGTGLATQRECLEVLGCYGKRKLNKRAESVAGVVLVLLVRMPCWCPTAAASVRVQLLSRWAPPPWENDRDSFQTSAAE